MPPLTVTVTLPSLPPLQLAGDVVSDALIAEGIVIVLVWSGPKQALLSFTCTVCEPAERLLKVVGEVQAANAPPSILH